jgi:SAM-dependent methyltransferase
MTNDKPLHSSEPFSLFNQYYDLLYQEKDYAGESRYITSLLNKQNSKPGELLELGCGTGNYAKEFSEAGFTVTGIEKSEQMVDVARSKEISNFFPIVDDITTFNLNRKFDAAVSLFHVISYLTENESVLSCFKRVAEHLNKDGFFIFDVWYTPAVYVQQPETRIKRLNTDSYEIIRIGEPEIFYELNVVEVNYTLIIKDKSSSQYDVLKEKHILRHYSTPEIKLLAQLSGFTVVSCEEFLTGDDPSADTWGVCYILKKND